MQSEIMRGIQEGQELGDFRGHNNAYSRSEGQSLLGATVFEVTWL